MNEILKTIDEWVKYLAANPYIGLGGFIIGVAGLLFSYYVAKRDKKVKNLSHYLFSNTIISDSQSIFPKLAVTYDGITLENFTVSKVRIFNSGTETIMPDDIAKSDPIRFCIQQTDKVKMLDSGAIYSSDPNNNFRIIQVDENTVEINFDFIEPKDEFVFQVIHTGKDSEVIKTTGTVIGAKSKFSDKKSLDTKRKYSSRISAVITSSILASIFGVISLLSFLMLNNYLLGGLCFIPAILFIFLAIRIATVKVKPSSALLSSAMTAALRKYSSEMEQEFADAASHNENTNN